MSSAGLESDESAMARRHVSPARWVARALVACGLYAAAASVGVAVSFAGSVVSLFWLPAGIAVAVLHAWGAPILAPLALTVAVFQHAIGAPWWAAAAMGAGGVAGPWVTRRLLIRERLDPAFGAARDFRALAFAALVGMTVPASVGVVMLASAGQVPAADITIAWLRWYAGDTLGVVLAAPLLLVLHAAWRAGQLRDPRVLLQDRAAVLAVVALIAASLLLASPTPQAPRGYASLFALQLAIAIGAARFGVLGVWSTLVAVALAVAVPAAFGLRPLVREQPTTGPWVAWLFMAITTVLAVLVLESRRRLQATQAALAERERELDAMFEQANAGISVSERSRYVRVNDAFCRMLGYPREELLGRDGADVTHPDDRAQHGAALRRWASGESGAVLYEKRYLHRDGTVVWARNALSVYRPRPDAPPRVVAVTMDISEQKRVEASLRRQREQLALVFDATGSGIWDHDLTAGRIFYSDSYLRMLGYPPDTVLPRLADAPERIHPDDRARYRASAQALYERRVPMDLEYRLRRADGGYVWVHARGYGAWDAAGRVLRTYGATADVTARKSAEAALVESRARLSAIIDSTLDAIVAVDDLGRIVLFNPAAEALFGRPAGHVMGGPMQVLVPARHRGGALERLLDLAADARPGAGRAGGRLTFEVLHADGSELPVDASMSMVTVDGRRLVTLVLRDARERRRVEAAERARAQAEAASRAKSDFLSRMSHELRTPLNAVLGFAQLLDLDGEAPLSASQRERVRAIREAGGHLGALIDELLDLTRIESDRLRLEEVELDLGAVARQCVRLVQPTAAEAGVALVPPVGDAPRAIGDPTRLRQVLVNLLSNAIKYNRRGGTVRLGLRALPGGEGTVCVEVEDDGPGIPAEDQTRLFEPFERLGRERGDIQGSGIGLALSRRLVELMGGTIEVDSEAGRGSVFRVRLRSAPRRPAFAVAGSSPGRPETAVERAAPDRA